MRKSEAQSVSVLVSNSWAHCSPDVSAAACCGACCCKCCCRWFCCCCCCANSLCHPCLCRQCETGHACRLKHTSRPASAPRHEMLLNIPEQLLPCREHAAGGTVPRPAPPLFPRHTNSGGGRRGHGSAAPCCRAGRPKSCAHCAPGARRAAICCAAATSAAPPPRLPGHPPHAAQARWAPGHQRASLAAVGGDGNLLPCKEASRREAAGQHHDTAVGLCKVKRSGHRRTCASADCWAVLVVPQRASPLTCRRRWHPTQRTPVPPPAAVTHRCSATGAVSPPAQPPRAPGSVHFTHAGCLLHFDCAAAAHGRRPHRHGRKRYRLASRHAALGRSKSS